MEQTLSVAKLFCGLTPPDGFPAVLAESEVLRADIDAEERRVAVSLRPAAYIPIKSLHAVSHALEEMFSLRELRFTPSYAPSLLETMDFSDLTQILLHDYPPARATLSGADWRLDGDTLHVRLRANGKDALTPYLPVAERYLYEQFGRKISIEIEACGISEDADLLPKPPVSAPRPPRTGRLLSRVRSVPDGKSRRYRPI